MTVIGRLIRDASLIEQPDQYTEATPDKDS